MQHVSNYLDKYKAFKPTIENARPTGNDCPKCGNPSTMFYCVDCEQSSEDETCLDCGKTLLVDKHYHDNCN